jgi:hypothetical protein
MTPQLGVLGRGILKGFLPFAQNWEKGLGDEGKPTHYRSDNSAHFMFVGARSL